MALLDRVRSVYNAFTGRSPTIKIDYGWYGDRPDRTRHRIQNERSIINSIYTRLSVDASLIEVRHVRLDESGEYKDSINDQLNRVLTMDANIDQTGKGLILDLVYSMLDEGSIALIATDTSENPNLTESYDVLEARVGKVIVWHPKNVRVEVYNENSGRREEILVEKRYTPIIENPFYPIMNEPNSTLQRLLRVLNQLDRVNEMSSSDKMNLIVQLPYPVRSRAQEKLAENRRKNVEAQLTNSRYGVAYVDGMEKIIQLNRPIENNLWTQAQELKKDLFDQMGLTMEILNGTADEKTMQNYYSRIIEPILTTIVEEITRKWLSKTAQSQRQRIRFFRDPFKLIPATVLADLSDKLTRNEIMTSNEVRTRIGLLPSSDPKANELRNATIKQPNEGRIKETEVVENEEDGSSNSK